MADNTDYGHTLSRPPCFFVGRAPPGSNIVAGAPMLVPYQRTYNFSSRPYPTQTIPFYGQTQAYNMPYANPMAEAQSRHIPASHPLPATPFSVPLNERTATFRGTLYLVHSNAPKWNQKVDAHPVDKAGDHQIALPLHSYDKRQVDSDYMGFIVIMERIWPQYLRPRLEEFCRGVGSIRRAAVDERVRDWMKEWMMREQVEREFPYDIIEARDRAHVEYEHRVRVWHVYQNMEDYQASAVLRLRQLGYMIGD